MFGGRPIPSMDATGETAAEAIGCVVAGTGRSGRGVLLGVVFSLTIPPIIPLHGHGHPCRSRFDLGALRAELEGEFDHQIS